MSVRWSRAREHSPRQFETACNFSCCVYTFVYIHVNALIYHTNTNTKYIIGLTINRALSTPASATIWTNCDKTANPNWLTPRSTCLCCYFFFSKPRPHTNYRHNHQHNLFPIRNVRQQTISYTFYTTIYEYIYAYCHIPGAWWTPLPERAQINGAAQRCVTFACSSRFGSI